jgi:hypothetical protein
MQSPVRSSLASSPFTGSADLQYISPGFGAPQDSVVVVGWQTPPKRGRLQVIGQLATTPVDPFSPALLATLVYVVAAC